MTTLAIVDVHRILIARTLVTAVLRNLLHVYHLALIHLVMGGRVFENSESGRLYCIYGFPFYLF